jgi:beta-lactamase regulating signal transducer with metallopeptidase domain
MGWLVIAVGWIFPFRPRIDLSFLPAQMTDIPVQPIINAIPSMTDAGDIVNAPAIIPLWLVLAAIWILGVVSVVLYHALRHGRFMKMVRRWSGPVTDLDSLGILDSLKSELGIKAQVRLSVCQSITSPMLVGFFRPAILLPPVKIAGDELPLILKHELIHFKRHDLWCKALILVATALHWFNPVVYLMAKATAAQCEISCDALVLRGADFQQRKQYGETIIGVVRNGTKLRTALSTNFYGGKKGMKTMKTRISSIMDTKRKKAGVAILCVALVNIIFTGATLAVAATDNSIANGSVTTNNQTGQISTDGGQTWMDEEAYQKMYPTPNINWWTYDEYKVWLEQEKINLQSLVNAPGWSQERIDNAIQGYEQQLEDIKNGALYSKSIEGYDGTVVMGSNITNSTVVANDEQYVLNPSGPPSERYSALFSLENGDTKDLGSYATKEECFEAVKAFCDEQVKEGKMTQQEVDRVLSEFR